MRFYSGAFFRFLVLTFLVTGVARAEEAPRRPSVIVSSTAQVLSSAVLLGDVARISAPDPEQAAVVETLKKLRIADAPPPLTKATILGATILDAIEKAGIERDTIGYSIPNAVVVERAGRTVSQEEVLAATRATIAENKDLDIQVRDISWSNSHIIPQGEAHLRIETLGLPTAGKMPLRVEVSVDNTVEARFLATALVDDWREVPVVSRTLERGRLISDEDVQLVRLNLHKQPADVVSRLENVIGRRVLTTLQAGETIKKSSIEIPPLIAKGRHITMIYEFGSLRATATGIALDDGLESDIIKIKNDSSGRVVRGKILNVDEVQVEAQ